MQISKYFKPEALMFAAFLATLPIYSPNQLLFETELLQRAAYMPAFANTLLGASVVLGVAVAIVSARGRLAVILRGGVVLVASVAYVAGYALFALAAGLESFAQPIFGVTAGLLLAVSTVVLSVAWGAYLGQFNLRQALLWLAVMVGVAALVELLLSSVTFAVGPTGLITINGQVTMGAGSTINWAQVNNQNIQSNPAYSLANNAYNLADDAYYEAELAYDRANRAYKLADSIEMPGYIKSTYIDQTTIRSPVIEGGEFYGEEFNIIAGGDFGSFNLYGPFGSSRYHMLAIEYFEGNAPLINIYSPCGGYITIGQSRNGIVYFKGVVDFSAADVQGLDLGTGA